MAKRKDEETKPSQQGSSAADTSSKNPPDSGTTAAPASGNSSSTTAGDSARTDQHDAVNSTAHSAATTAAARISTAFYAGAPRRDYNVSEAHTQSTGPTTMADLTPVPGILVLDYMPTLGYSADVSSALNRASNVAFNAIRAQISGNRPYAPSDHMIYRVAVDGLRELYLYIARIYGLVSSYKALNLYTPRDLLTAMGLNTQDMINNAAAIYQWLLMHRGSLEPFPTIPMGKLTVRRELFNTAVFQDGEIQSAQFYLLNQKAFYSYEKVDTVGGLTPREIPQTATWQNLKDMWDSMYNALTLSSDAYIIAADIRRAYPDKYVTALPEIPLTYEVPMGKSDLVLDSIMNANIISTKGGTLARWNNTLRIVDQAGVLICKPVYTDNLWMDAVTPENNGLPAFWKHLNAITTDMDVDHVLRALALHAMGTVSGAFEGTSTKATAELTTFSFEVCTGCRIYTRTSQSDTLVETDVYGVSVFGTGTSAIQLAAKLSVFDWHPPVGVRLFAVGETDGDFQGWLDTMMTIEDIQNYIPITEDVIASINDAYLLEMFGVE